MKHQGLVLPGDIIGIDRTGYEHYGIYCGNNQVIHFTSENSDVSARHNVIVETGMSVFMRGQLRFFVLDIDRLIADKDVFTYLLAKEGKQYRIFGGSETVQRARSMLGKTDYDLLYNNCEHFAMWCKTGVPEMNQLRLLHRVNRYKKHVSNSDHLQELLYMNQVHLNNQQQTIRADDESIAAIDREVKPLLQQADRLAAEHERFMQAGMESDEIMRNSLSKADEILNRKKH